MNHTTALQDTNTDQDVKTIQPEPTPRRRPHRLAATIAGLALLMSLTGTAPAAAAENGNACFSYKGGHGLVQPLSGVRVQMYYFDFDVWSWQYAGSGFDRYTTSNGCAYYDLPNLGNHVNGQWWQAEGHYDWSTQYVMFAVWDVSSSGAAQRTYYGLSNGYVAPGNYQWQLNGTAACWGVTCG